MNITRLSSLSIKRPFAQQACAHTHAEHHDSHPKTIKIGTNEYPAETMEKIKLLNQLSKNNVWDDQHGKPRVLCFGEDRKAAHSIHNWFLSAHAGLIKEKHQIRSKEHHLWDVYPSARYWYFPYKIAQVVAAFALIAYIYSTFVPEEYRLRYKYRDLYHAHGGHHEEHGEHHEKHGEHHEEHAHHVSQFWLNRFRNQGF